VGDVFEVRVFQEAELSGVYRVGPEGTIDFPLCGRLEVRGQTSAEVATRLRTCLAEGYLRNPQVTVVTREYNSKKVFVFGQVQRPGTFPFEENMTVIQAITVSGGFTQFAGQNKTRVTRTTEQGEERFEVPVQDIGVGKAPNFYLRPGDIVFVPESWI
jgi:protein involved in polysaccharide export with SLBB domain